MLKRKGDKICFFYSKKKKRQKLSFYSNAISFQKCYFNINANFQFLTTYKNVNFILQLYIPS